jgi:sn-glycerol 3-phosphate transport system permease protein
MADALLASLPVLVLTVPLAAFIVARATLASRGDLRLGAGVGAAVGVLAPLAVLHPLDYCTFGPEAALVDQVLGGVLVLGLTWFGTVIAASALDPETKRRRARSGDDVSHGIFRGHPVLPWVLLAPTLVILVLFLYWPAVRTVQLSTKLVRLGAPRGIDRCVTNFTELIGPERPMLVLAALIGAVVLLWTGSRLQRRGSPVAERWAGPLSAAGVAGILLFLTLLWTASYRQVFIVTMIVSIGVVVGGLAISLAIAILAYQPVRGGAVYRTLLIWPYAISPPIAGLIFYVMFDPNSGIVEHLLDVWFGFGLPNYRQSPNLAIAVVILASIWKTLGYNLLFYIAGLQTVPKDQMEAAMLDGASSWTRFRYVTLPAISPITFFLIVTNLTYAFFETFGTVDYLTAGGPARATTIAMYEIYQVAIPGRDLGRGAAQSLILFVGVIALTVWQFRSTGRRVSYGR